MTAIKLFAKFAGRVSFACYSVKHMIKSGACNSLHAFSLSADFFFQNQHYRIILPGINTTRMSISLNPDHARHISAVHDLGSYCLLKV